MNPRDSILRRDQIRPGVPSDFRYKSAFRPQAPRTPYLANRPLAGKFLAFEDPLIPLNQIRRDESMDMRDRRKAEQRLSLMLASTPGQNNLLLFNENMV